MRQQFTNGGVRLRNIRLEVPNVIVQRQPPFFNAAEQVRGGQKLSQAVDVERRVGARGDRPFNVLPAEGLLPDDVARSDDGNGQGWNARLDAKRFDVVAYELEDRGILGVKPHRKEERNGNRGGQEKPSHQDEVTRHSVPPLLYEKDPRWRTIGTQVA